MAVTSSGYVGTSHITFVLLHSLRSITRSPLDRLVEAEVLQQLLENPSVAAVAAAAAFVDARSAFRSSAVVTVTAVAF